MAVSPLPQSAGIASLSVKINGLDPPVAFEVISAEVIDEKETSATASIKILAGGSAATGLEDFTEVKPGNSISIAAGYRDKCDELFSGTIQSIEEDISNTGPATITISCTATEHPSPVQREVPILAITYGTDMLAFNAKLSEPNKITGTVGFQGSALAKTGETIAIRNVGQTFSGNWLITKVIQHVSDGDWITTVDFTGN